MPPNESSDSEHAQHWRCTRGCQRPWTQRTIASVLGS